jgi:peptide/nickel transport system permease protein
MSATRRVFAAPSTKIAGVVLLIVLLLTITGGLLAPHDPLAQNVPNQFQHPSSGHLLGTDYLGRDTLSRLIAGTRITILGSFATVALGFLIGALPGIVSAFLGRTSEFFVMRTVDALLTLPIIVLAVAATGLFSNGTGAVIIAVGVLLAPRFFRIARAETLGFASEQYVEAAELFGASRFWIIRRHIWSKVLPTLAVTSATSLGYAVLALSSLDFLGIGVRAPAPSWGGMLASDVQYLYQDWSAAIWPGLAIAITVWACNAVADGLRDGLGAQAGGHGVAGEAVPAHDLDSLLGSELIGTAPNA